LKIAVLGSSGAMGNFFAELFLARGERVVGSDKVRKRPPIGSRFSFVPSNAQAVGGAKFVLVAVPMKDTTNVILEVADHLRAGAIVFEISSIKGDSLGRARRVLRGRGARLVSIHPLFGPSMTSEGFKLAVVGSRDDLIVTKSLFPKARTFRLGAKEHDRLMAYVQSLIHLTNLALASSISRGVGFRAFRRAAPPTSEAQLEVAKAVLSQCPMLYSRIQTENPFAKEALESISAEIERLRRAIDSREPKAIERTFSALASEFSKRELAAALGAMYSLSKAD
jgi:prephenate dehydrogenase